MIRDMELIREILLTIQARPDSMLQRFTLDGYDQNVVGRHVQLLVQEGYLDGKVHDSSLQHQLTCFVSDLTWKGHDFVAAIQNDTVWEKIKNAMSPKELATAPITLIKTLGMRLLEDHLKQLVGLGA